MLRAPHYAKALLGRRTGHRRLANLAQVTAHDAQAVLRNARRPLRERGLRPSGSPSHICVKAFHVPQPRPVGCKYSAHPVTWHSISHCDRPAS